MSGIRAIAVVIPVHDEEELLAGCLEAVVHAARRAPATVDRVLPIVVLDGCSDRSADIAAWHPVTSIEIDVCRVGAARRFGVEYALAALGADSRVWIANTDADSRVAPDWLRHQVLLADGGADVTIGTVEPDFADLSPAHVELWHATHPPGEPNGHVHGANLGIRANLYRAAGGFAAVDEHEDVQLVQRARAAGAIVVPSDGSRVRTSGRFVGRTPGGYAGYLRMQSEALAAVGSVSVSDAALTPSLRP